MALELKIVKKLPEFTLNVSFSAGNAPLGVLGPSGAGKTMLLRCVAGLESPDRGRIVLNGRVLFDSDRRIHVPARDRRVGMLFQHYALFPHRTVAENIAFGLKRFSPAEQSERVANLVARTHISGLELRYPRQLSGGEQQRAALARALAIEPEALLLDEPLSALDTHLRSQIEQQLQETFTNYQRPSLLVTHNMEEAYRLGERLMVLSRGCVIAFGPKEEVFRHPATCEVAQLTGCKNLSRAKPISEGFVEAIDWGCRLRVENTITARPSYIGIRAHHVDFVEAIGAADANNTSSGENVFPCWLAQVSETPFRVTLYLSLHRPGGLGNEHHLQVEVFKEKWQRFRDRSFPWHVRLSPENLFLMRE